MLNLDPHIQESEIITGNNDATYNVMRVQAKICNKGYQFYYVSSNCTGES